MRRIIIIVLLLLVMPMVGVAKSVINIVEEGKELDYKITGNYGWTFNLKNAKLNVSDYHLINTKQEAESHNITVATEEDYYNKSKNYYIENETDCSDNNIYVVYNNVGMYQGKNINVKINVEGCKLGNSPTKVPNIGFSSSEMQVIINGLRYIDLRYEFTDSDGNIVDIKGYGTFRDLDFSQAFKMGEGIDNAFIYKKINDVEGHLLKDKLTKDDNYSEYQAVENAIQSSNAETNSDRNYMYAWATILFSGGKFNLRYYLGQPGWESNFNGGGMFIFYPDSIVPFSVADPVKNVNKHSVVRTEEFTYTISHRVPYINLDGSNNKYIAYSFNDVLEPCLTVDDVSKIVIKNDEGTDVTKNFDVKVSEENGSIVVDAIAKDELLSSNDFYGHEYEFLVNAQVKENYDLSKYINSDSSAYIIPNVASISVTDNYGVSNKKTNNVEVMVPIPKKSVEVPDTSEFISSSLIVGGGIIIILAIGTFIIYKKRATAKN